MIEKGVVIYLILLCLIVVLFIFIYKRRGPSVSEQLGYTKNDKLLIINADDLGLHKDITDGIIEVINAGICRSTGIMPPCPDFERTAKLMVDKNKDVDLGIHLTLTITNSYEKSKKYHWSPVLSREVVPSLYNDDGYMWHDMKNLLKHAKVNEVLMELDAQIQKVLSAGIKPSFIDGHHEFYLYSPELLEVVLSLSKKYNLPLRVEAVKISTLLNPLKIRSLNKNIKYMAMLNKYKKEGLIILNSVTFFYNIAGEEADRNIRKNTYFNYLKKLKPGVHELGIHPGILKSKEMREFLGKPYIIENEQEIWSGEETKKLIGQLDIKIIECREIQKLQSKKIGF